MLGIIGGTGLLYSHIPQDSPDVIDTPYGSAEVYRSDGAIFLFRHQRGFPPHRINARAQLAALAIIGVDRVIAIGSVGSLSPLILPGTLLIPTDYLTTGIIPTFHDYAIVHVLPRIATDLAAALHGLIPEAKYGGIYVQTQGPRLETVAEVQAYSRLGDVVGMTLANEATLANELGIPFAAICSVDNYANGLAQEVPSYEHILAMSQRYRQRTDMILHRIVDGLR